MEKRDHISNSQAFEALRKIEGCIEYYMMKGGGEPPKSWEESHKLLYRFILNSKFSSPAKAIRKISREIEQYAGLTTEEWYLFRIIIAAREIQTFLWGVANGAWGLEEWRRMFIKRYKKIQRIDKNNSHAMTEFKKRLLQNAALSVAMLAILNDKKQLTEDTQIPSNLPQYTRYEEVGE